MDKINILIVDDHPMMREAMRTALEEEPDLNVIGEASDGLQAVRMYKELEPDLVMMDLLLPGIDGLEATAQILKNDPRAKIIVVSSLEDQENILAATQVGALGYFPKTAPRQHLLEAIHKVADGLPYMPAGITAKLFQSLREMKETPPDNREPTESLTSRQQQILALMGEGRSDQEVADILKIEEATVRTHVHNILQRLGFETRAQAVAFVNRL